MTLYSSRQAASFPTCYDYTCPTHGLVAQIQMGQGDKPPAHVTCGTCRHYCKRIELPYYDEEIQRDGKVLRVNYRAKK
jgi:hypothetical protein